MNILYIDTSDNKKTIIKVTGVINDILENETTHRSSQVVLPMIDEILKRNNLALSHISEIHVHTGPGSFTGLRVGVAIAQALSFAKNISVNGKDFGEYVEPQYT